MEVLFEKKEKISLDAKDWRILYVLIKNPRLPISKIAKECQISRNSVEYRINQMKEKGLITGFKSVINISKLNYQSFHVFLTLNSTKNEKEFLERLNESKYVNSIISYKGKFNYEISIMTKSLKEALEVYSNLIREMSISNEEILILLSTIKSEVLPLNFFKKEVTIKPSVNKILKKSSIYDVDDTDIKLMRLLANTSNLNNVEIANELKISTDIVRYKIKKLVDSDYILEFRPAINYNILNLSMKTILLKLNYFYYDKHKEFEQFLKGDGSVIWATSSFGKYDYILYILTDDYNELHEFFDKINDKFGSIIKVYELLLAHKQYKYSFMSDSVSLK